jgi:hypothetical protein
MSLPAEVHLTRAAAVSGRFRIRDWRRMSTTVSSRNEDYGMSAHGVPGAEVVRQQRRRCFLSLHFLFKDLTHYQE